MAFASRNTPGPTPRGRAATALAGTAGFALSVAPGSLTALLGAPGSGKSAVMRLLAGSGGGGSRVLALGRDVTGLSPGERGFGVVRQPDTLAGNLTLAQNVAAALRARKMPAAGQAALVAEVMEQLGLTGVAGRRPDEVGRAERQRTVLARAVVFQPKILLLDEPFGDQDMAGRAELAACLRRLHALLEATTLLATAQGQDALETADHIAVLRDGCVIQHETAQAVYERPASLYAARLLGEVSTLPGRVAEVFDDTAMIRLSCGPLVEAAAPGLRLGDDCVLVLRPERIALAPVPAAEMGEDAIDATVIEARCLGETARVSVLIGTGAGLVLRRPAAAGLRGVVPGAAVSIAWQPHHALALPPDS